MASSLDELIRGFDITEPPEFAVIKKFVQDLFQHDPKVSVSHQTIVISVPGAALAGALRPHLHELQTLCETDKRLMIRISH